MQPPCFKTEDPGRTRFGRVCRDDGECPLPVKNEEANSEIKTEEATLGEYVETADNIPGNTDVKEEEDQEMKSAIDNIQPVTNNVLTNMELVEKGNGFVPTSVITYFSPVIEVEELVRSSDTPKQGNRIVTIDKGSLTDDKLLDLITSFHEPKVNMIKCGYCGLMSRNFVVHIRMNHKRSRPF